MTIENYLVENMPLVLRVLAIVGITLIALRVIVRFVVARLRVPASPKAMPMAAPMNVKTLPPRRIVRDIQRRPQPPAEQPLAPRRPWAEIARAFFPWLIIIVVVVTSISFTQAQRGPSQPITPNENTPAWASSLWPYRIALTVNHALVAEDVTDFPVLVSLNESQHQPFKDAATAGKMMFTTREGEELPHEIEHYDAATSTLLAWVKLPRLSSTADTSFFLYFGNNDPAIGGASNGPAVWSNGYVGVYHLTRDDSGAVVVDSTKAIDDPFYRLTAGRSALVPGKIGAALRFDNEGDVIDLGHVANEEAALLPPFTISAWVNPQAAAGTIVGKRTAAVTQWQFFTDQRGYLNLKEDSTGRWPGHQSYGTAATALLLNFWQHVAVSVDQSGTPVFYNDGLRETGSYSDGTFTAYPTPASAGARWSAYPGATYNLRGDLDAIRISSVERSAGWLKTERDNQAYPALFVSATAPVSYSPEPHRTTR